MFGAAAKGTDTAGSDIDLAVIGGVSLVELSEAVYKVEQQLGRPTLAYEGYFSIVQAVLEHHQVPTREAGRSLAIQRVAQDLQLSIGEFAIITKAHERRNHTSYTSPFPPLSKAEAASMLAILRKSLSAARAHLGVMAP